MKEISLTASIPCHDRAELLQFERIIWGENDEYMAFSIMDGYMRKTRYQGVFGRFRRAGHVFFAKPIYYAEVIVMEQERVRAFLTECLAVLDVKAGGEDRDEDDTAEQAE